MSQVDVTDLTIKQVREIANFASSQFEQRESCTKVPCNSISPWVLEKNYLIRTVTMILTGRLVQVTPEELVIIDAAWIAETERWADSVKSGKFKEVEPYPDNQLVIIGRGSIIDATAVVWPLPRGQK